MRWLPFIALAIGGFVLAWRSDDAIRGLAGLENGELAALLVGGTVLVFIGASVLTGYRGRLGQALRDMAAWSVIGFALVAGYAYRTEVTQLAERITSELMPPGEGQVIEGKTAGERGLRIRRRGDGHFVVKTSVNGASVSMLVDTGASTVVLRAVDAKAMGLDINKLSYTVPVQTANGTAYAAAVRLRHVAIGPITIDGVEALVARHGALKESLLGMSFLRRLRAYEFSGDFLTLKI